MERESPWSNNTWYKELVESMPRKERQRQKRKPVRTQFNKDFVARKWDFRQCDLVEWFRTHDAYLQAHEIEPDKHLVQCPFEHEHSETKERDSDTMIRDGSGDMPPLFFCSHGHSLCEDQEAHGRHDLEAVADLWGDALEFRAKRLDDDLQRNDDGNARRFAIQFGDTLRYCTAFRQWYVWTGTHWKADGTEEIINFARSIIDQLKQEASEVDPKDRKGFVSYLHKSASSPGLRAIPRLAQSIIPVLAEEMDRNPMHLNFRNGTLELWSGLFRDHNPADMLTRCLPFDFDAAATCPNWEKFVASVTGGDEQLLDFLQRAVGYSLTGLTSEKCFFILHGPGDTGKTTFVEAIGRMLGQYGQLTQPQLLLTRKSEGIPSDLAMLKGARFVWTSETEEGRKLSTAMVKAMTGSDSLQARFMYKDWFSFVPTFKLWLATNHKPVIRESGQAIWQRVRLVPFVVQTPKEKQDRRLLEKLTGEYPGMMQWALVGLQKWRESGLGTCDLVDSATGRYQQEMDLLSQFLDEECLRGPQAQATTKQLHDAYTAWCKSSGEFSISLRRFGSMLDERGIERRDVRNVMVCFGIRPITAMERIGIRAD